MFKLVVLSCMLAAAASNVITPWSSLGLAASLTGLSPISPILPIAPMWTTSNYRGPLSLAPGQPANIIAADGRPLDTLDVNVDRAAHITAKALDGTGVRLLKKRSVSPLIAPLAANRINLASATLGVNRIALSPTPLGVNGIAVAPVGVNRINLAPVPLGINGIAVGPTPLGLDGIAGLGSPLIAPGRLAW